MSDQPGTRTLRWRYRAADERGVERTGELDAATERDAVDALRRRALWATSVEPMTAHTRGASEAHALARPNDPATARDRLPVSRLARRLVGPSEATELAVAVRAMAALTEAGVPVDRALGYAAGAAGTERLQRAFGRLVERVRAGASLSSAMAAEPAIPRVFPPTVAAAEASGTLGRTLVRLADHLEQDEAARARLRSALVYPAVLGVASTLGVIVMLLVVVPRFATLVADAGGTLPLSTRALVAASGLLVRWWWLLLAIVALLVTGWRGWRQDPANRARWHRFRLTLPVAGRLERTREAARYTRVLATALGTGVPLLAAMGLARGTVVNVVLARSLEEAESAVHDGGPLGAALEGTLPPLAVRLIDAGEAGGNLAEMTGRAAEAAEAETSRVTSALVSLVEPALIVAFGLVVGFVALALLQAIYGINARGL